MQTNCTIQGCPNYGRYCRLHSVILAGVKQPPKPIKKKSDKRKDIDNKQYLPAMRKYIKDHPNCAVKMKGCTGKAQGIHHKKGKSSTELLMDKKYWMPCCNHCNLSLEILDSTARKKGFKLSRHKKESQD